jgi:predicted ABC-type ATPase
MGGRIGAVGTRRNPPLVVVVAGPNGAGKSTVAPALLKQVFDVEEFVNADTIAAGLSAMRPERVAVQAGRVMLRRIRGLAADDRSFGFETTLASRHFAPWLAGLRRGGYRICLVFLALPHADMAVARVCERIRVGGHSVPEATIRRRFRRGRENLLRDYLGLADEWILLDNSGASGPRLVAEGGRDTTTRIKDEAFWSQFHSQD